MISSHHHIIYNVITARQVPDVGAQGCQ